MTIRKGMTIIHSVSGLLVIVGNGQHRGHRYYLVQRADGWRVRISRSKMLSDIETGQAFIYS